MDGKLTTLTSRKIEIKRKLVEATKAVRKKMRAIKMGQVQSEALFEKTFKPLIESLKGVALSVKQQQLPTSPPPPPPPPPVAKREAKPIVKSEVKQPPKSEVEEPALKIEQSWADKYVELRMNPKTFDTQYDVYVDYDDGGLKMGDADVDFDNKIIMLSRNGWSFYRVTFNRPLFDAVFKTEPVDLSDRAKSVYVKLLHLTNTARKNYNSKEAFNPGQSAKYTELIKPVMDEYATLKWLRRRLRRA